METKSSMIDVAKKAAVVKIKLKNLPKVVFPKRAPSIVIPEREIIYISADKTTCAECTCFPKESSYVKPLKLRMCLQSPLTLYELAGAVVDILLYPEPFIWTEDDVVEWLENVVQLPQYKECFIDNHINGRRLIHMEDSRALSLINIQIYEHAKKIIDEVKRLFKLDYYKFSRSIGLPPRKPLTHCTWFKSRTGPSWGIRQNWTRCDILRWMKILDPAPVYRDHWEMVWYQAPEFPRTLFARIPPAPEREKIPIYVSPPEYIEEFMVERKFRIDRTNLDEKQFIWMERVSKLQLSQLSQLSQLFKQPTKPKVKIRKTLLPKKICLKGLSGNDLILARRLLPKQKFFT